MATEYLSDRNHPYDGRIDRSYSCCADHHAYLCVDAPQRKTLRREVRGAFPFARSLDARQPYDQIERADADDGHDGRPMLSMRVIALRDEIACADIEEEAGEERE